MRMEIQIGTLLSESTDAMNMREYRTGLREIQVTLRFGPETANRAARKARRLTNGRVRSYCSSCRRYHPADNRDSSSTGIRDNQSLDTLKENPRERVVSRNRPKPESAFLHKLLKCSRLMIWSIQIIEVDESACRDKWTKMTQDVKSG